MRSLGVVCEEGRGGFFWGEDLKRQILGHSVDDIRRGGRIIGSGFDCSRNGERAFWIVRFF